jgi:hypothetical protein
MTAFKLFISHSSRLDEAEGSNDPEQNPNLKLLRDVIQDIKNEYGETIEILVDKDEKGLPVGHDWEKRLNEWLAECHAAVILFSKRAIEKSNWVKKEATILSWRRELDTNFRLIPVLLQAQTNPDDLERDLFGTLRISKDQCIRDVNTSQDVLNGIKIALGDKETLQAKIRQTPFDKLQRVIAKLLAKDSDMDALQEAWETLEGADKPDWHPDELERFAHNLTRYLLRDNGNALINYEKIINKIRPKVKKDNAREIFEYLRSLWVDTKAASCISQGTVHKKFLVQNGNYLPNYTFKCYTERAWPMDDNLEVVFTSTADKKLLLEQIRDPFKESKRIPLTPEQIDEKINTFSQQILIYIPAFKQNGGGLLDDIHLRTELRKKYPNIIFVLGTGEQLPTSIADDIAKVVPELDVTTEFKQLNSEDNTERFLNKFYTKKT